VLFILWVIWSELDWLDNFFSYFILSMSMSRFSRGCIHPSYWLCMKSGWFGQTGQCIKIALDIFANVCLYNKSVVHENLIDNKTHDNWLDIIYDKPQCAMLLVHTVITTYGGELCCCFFSFYSHFIFELDRVLDCFMLCTRDERVVYYIVWSAIISFGNIMPS
jgi:hypothetical protein